MDAFQPGRKQDAAPTFRGFKYQVQLTILRWFELSDNEVLYLESGEDIDRVCGAPDLATRHRELEQVKARTRNITLRSADALTALANFATHVLANPGHSLSLCFTTTAQIGREKISPLGSNTAALNEWNKLRCKSEWTSDDDTVGSHLRDILQESTQPKKCSEKTWQSLMTIVNEAAEISFKAFLQKCEWSCGAPSPEQLDTEVLHQIHLLLGNDAPSEDPALYQKHEQLMLAIFSLLSTPGEKILTRLDLIHALARHTLTSADRDRLRLLEEHSESLDARISSLQDSVHRMGLADTGLLVFGEIAFHFQGISCVHSLPAPPPLVSKLSRRSHTVNAISHDLNTPRCVWIHGDYGMGKSHLSYLIAERIGGIIFGVSMRGLTIPISESSLALLTSQSETLDAIRSSIEGVVLLDDIPDYESQSRFETLLASFIQKCIDEKRTVILSSRRPPTEALTSILSSNVLSFVAPSFSDDDARELFHAHDIDGSFLTDDRLSSLNVTCRGHPMLLTALARHLQDTEGDLDKALLNALLSNAHRTKIDIEVARAVLDTVEAKTCRFLLYRLACAGTDLSLDEIKTVASLEPALPEPTGCVAQLDGLWIRHMSNRRYEVSPLTSPLSGEIPVSLSKSVHSTVAKLIIARRSLSISEFLRAITSMLVAGETNSAASHLVYACARYPYKSAGYSSLGVRCFFPVDCDSDLRPSTELALRAAQAITASIENADPKPYIERIGALTQSPTKEVAFGAVFAGSLLLTSSMTMPMNLAVFGAQLIENFRASPLLPETTLPVVPGHPDGTHLILPSACIKTWDDLDAYTELLGSLSADRRNEVASLPVIRHSAQVIISRALFDDAFEPTPEALTRLARLEERYHELGLLIFAAYSVAGRMVVFGEYQRDLNSVRTIAEHARHSLADEPIALSVIEATFGQQLFINGKYSDALVHLRLGLADSTHIVSLERGNRLVDAICAAWQIEEETTPFAEELNNIISGEEFSSNNIQCQMHAQLALVNWRNDHRNNAFEHFEKSVVHLTELEDNLRYRTLGAGLAHAIIYCASIVETGSPPPAAADGGEFIEADPRWFSGTYKPLAGIWREDSSMATLQWRLGRLAAAIGMEEAASVWLDRAFDLATDNKSPALISMLAPHGIASAVRRTDWNNAIDTALISGRAHIIVDNVRNDVSNEFDSALCTSPLDEPSSTEERHKAERYSLWLLSRIFACELAPIVTGNSEVSQVINGLSDGLNMASRITRLGSVWCKMADSVRLFMREDLPLQSHKEAIRDTTDANYSAVSFLAHGLLAFHPDADMRQAVVSQVGVLHTLCTESQHLEVSIDKYADSLVTYWLRAITRAAFRFSAPRQVKKDLEAASLNKYPIRRAKLVLSVVLPALSAYIDQPATEWLHQERLCP